jgi:hypothetical protein
VGFGGRLSVRRDGKKRRKKTEKKNRERNNLEMDENMTFSQS